MSQSSLSRIAPPVALAAGALLVITAIVTRLTIPSDAAALGEAVLAPTHAINSAAVIAAFALLSVALVAIFEWEAHAAGWLGVLGLCTAIVGTVVMAGDWWYEAFAVPWIAEDAPALVEAGVGARVLVGGLISFALFGIGWILFGAASLRAGVFPAGISIGIIAGGLVSALPIAGAYLYGHIVLGMTVGSLGLWMMRRSAAAVGLAGQSAARA
jgi:hypothetical protein